MHACVRVCQVQPLAVRVCMYVYYHCVLDGITIVAVVQKQCNNARWSSRGRAKIHTSHRSICQLLCTL